MNDILEQLISIARGMWRYHWQATAAAWAIVLSGWTVLYFLATPVYTAKAQIHVETDTVLRPLMEGLTLEFNLRKQLDLMTRQLMSPSNLEQVVQRTRLHRDVSTKTPLGVVAENLRKSLKLELERPIREDQPSNFYVVSYRNTDPVLAKEIVQSLLTAFADNTLAEIRKDSERAKQFVDEQIAAQEEQLLASEQRLREYRRDHVGLLPERGLTYFERLQAAQLALRDTELEIKETESRRNELQAQIDNASVSPRAFSPDGKSGYDPSQARLQELRKQLDQLLLKFTEAHPDVVRSRASIARIEKEMAAAADSGKRMGYSVYQQLEILARQVDGELAALRTKRESYVSRVAVLKDQRETLPMVEDQLSRLLRAHEATEERHKALVTRRQNMEVSEDVEKDSADLKFRVVDPPEVRAKVILQTHWQKQLLRTTFVLLAAIAGGAAIAYVLAQLRPPVFSPRTLNELTGLPVLCVTSQVVTSSVKREKRFDLTAFFCSILFLLLIYGAALIIQHHVIFTSQPPITEEPALNGVTQ